MIITDRFIMINFPKTGSTFARKVLEKLHSSSNKNFIGKLIDSIKGTPGTVFSSIMLPEIEFPNGKNQQFDQHGKWEQVPYKHRSKPVVSIARNPFERYISAYEFGLWKTYLVDDLDIIKQYFPFFPELNFEQYLQYQDFQVQYRFPNISGTDKIGNQTAQFIQYFFTDPRAAMMTLDDEYIYSGNYKKHLPPITLLRNENLNQDLFAFLLSQGYRKQDISFILDEDRIRPDNTNRLSDQERNSYFTESAIMHVEEKERYLFQIYADHDIDYRHRG